MICLVSTARLKIPQTPSSNTTIGNLKIKTHHGNQRVHPPPWQAPKKEGHVRLVGGFKHFEKHESNWESSPSRVENNKYLKPPPSKGLLSPSSFPKKAFF